MYLIEEKKMRCKRKCTRHVENVIKKERETKNANTTEKNTHKMRARARAREKESITSATTVTINNNEKQSEAHRQSILVAFKFNVFLNTDSQQILAHSKTIRKYDQIDVAYTVSV